MRSEVLARSTRLRRCVGVRTTQGRRTVVTGEPVVWGSQSPLTKRPSAR